MPNAANNVANVYPTSAASKCARLREPTTIGGGEKQRDAGGPRAGADAIHSLPRRDRQRIAPGDVRRVKNALIGQPQRQRGQRQQQEARPQHADGVAEQSEQQRRKESAEAAQRADQAGDRTGVAREPLGTSLNTAPLPRPNSAAQPSAPTVNGIIDGQIISSENAATPPNTHDSTCAPPIRSESQPPSGRISVASTTKPAARKPASAGAKPNCARSSVGK